MYEKWRIHFAYSSIANWARVSVGPRPTLFLIGGSSSVGKSTVAGRLAERFAMEVVRVDELLHAVTDPDAFFPGDIPSIRSLTAEQLCQRLISKGNALEPVLHDIASRILQEGRSAVVEGEGIQPQLALHWRGDGRVLCVLVIEEDAQRLAETLRVRISARKNPTDPWGSEAESIQQKMGKVNALYGRWLRDEAGRYGTPWVPSQPWETLFERFLEV